MSTEDRPKNEPATTAEAVPVAAATSKAASKPARRPIVHTQDRDPAKREQWKRERAIALGHAAPADPKPASK